MKDNTDVSEHDNDYDQEFEEAIQSYQVKSRSPLRITRKRTKSKIEPGHLVYQLPENIKTEVSNLLKNPDAIELVGDACWLFVWAKTKERPRAILNKKLVDLRQSLGAAAAILNEDGVSDAVGLLAFGMSPSKQTIKFKEKLANIIKGLSSIPTSDGRGRPKGSANKGVGRPAEVFCDLLCKACQIAGYDTNNGMAGKVEELVTLLDKDKNLNIDFPRKILDAIQRVRNNKR